jgi:hypothetical protein
MLNNCIHFIQLSRTNEFTNEILRKSAANSAGNATNVSGTAGNAIVHALDDMALDVMDIVGLLADLSFHSSGANSSSESQVRERITKLCILFFFEPFLPFLGSRSYTAFKHRKSLLSKPFSFFVEILLT